jgi:hypothetical protein
MGSRHGDWDVVGEDGLIAPVAFGVSGNLFQNFSRKLTR